MTFMTMFGGLYLASALLLLAPPARAEDGAEDDHPACATSLPPRLEVPNRKRPDFALSAKGVQIYTCKQSSPSSFAWTFVAPEARLFASHGRLAGHHYAGPTWKVTDGSAIVAAVVASERVDDDAIPWLLLQVTAHEGAGRLSQVRYVQRTATEGGLAPADGCDATRVGAQVEVPYTADYLFYR
jgi:hypothetical protein